MSAGFCLRGAAVLGPTGTFEGPIDVAVEDGVVTAVGQAAPSDAPSVDASGLFVMPGMVECHDHLTMSTVDLAECLTTPATELVLRAARNARVTLEGGVTFVRDLAGLDRGIRDGFARGYVPAPRIQTSIVMLSQTGGHGDSFLAGPGIEASALMIGYPGRPPIVVDGVDAMRKAVRELLRGGADWIKVAATGGLVSDHDQPLVAEFTTEELEAAAFEGRRKGKPLAAHAYGGEGLTNAVLAGARSIEHGGFLTEEQATLMAERGCWLVPTLAAMRDCIRFAEEGLLTPTQCEKVLGFGLELGACVMLAKEHGVRLASGTDYISSRQHGRNLEELSLLRKAGLTAAEALLAGTAWGADLCGVGDRIGRIAPGFRFDAIVLDADPGDLSCFEQPGAVAGVFKEGAVVLPHPQLAGQGLVPPAPELPA
ncbi:MAG: amidohydrolase family protein [Actinobacteria bacterium]|nr:amidohydrolase family protein [Actinomycetota bacterium]